jgi:ribonuclease P protein subunit RPR2
VFAVADTLDALTTDRPYRPASDWTQARTEIRRFAGSQFDPKVVAAYEGIGDDVFAGLRGAL